MSEDMMVGDAKGKSKDVGIGKNGTKYREGPELARDISGCKCAPAATATAACEMSEGTVS